MWKTETRSPGSLFRQQLGVGPTGEIQHDKPQVTNIFGRTKYGVHRSKEGA